VKEETIFGMMNNSVGYGIKNSSRIVSTHKMIFSYQMRMVCFYTTSFNTTIHLTSLLNISYIMPFLLPFPLSRQWTLLLLLF